MATSSSAPIAAVLHDESPEPVTLSPFQHIYKTVPDYGFLKTYGCEAVHHTQSLYRVCSLVTLKIKKGYKCLHVPTDADWASDPLTRKSTSGYCTFLGDNLLSWTVKKQYTVARSSIESEYRALAALTTNVIWIRLLLNEFHEPITQPTDLYCDNTSSIALTNHPMFHARTKHIEIDQRFIRDHIQNQHIRLLPISTVDQVVDIFAKPLSTPRFQRLRFKLTVTPDPSSCREEQKCIVFNWSLAKAITVVRSATDFIYFLHMLLQFRLAYVAPESRVVGAGDLVDQPKKIVMHYLRGYFLLDLFVVLPLPQVMILVVIPKYVGTSSANYAKNLLRFTVLLQYIPRIIRFLPLLAGQSASGFIFESAWANFVINLLMFVLTGHVVGSCWYLFGLQRVNQCLKNACSDSVKSSCFSFIDCGSRHSNEQFYSSSDLSDWQTNPNATACFSNSGPFQYGIYAQAVNLITENSVVTRYLYSLFWGFQQISTLAGNQTPSYFKWEVLFTMAIGGLGLLLFALLIGNMQNFLLALGRRRLEMQLRRRDVEQWMSHRRLPEELRRKVRQAERFCWAATRGVNEEELLEKLPEDLQRDIRRHFFNFLKKVRIFSLMDEPVLDAVFEKLGQTLYIGGSDILYQGGPIDKMVFIVRGKLESIGADGNVAPLSEGDVCGEELLTWCLEHSANKALGRVRLSRQRLFSNRTVRCLTNVEAFALRAADLEEVTVIFSRFLRNPRVQGAIRYESPYWRYVAATRIQVAWRYRQWRLKRANKSSKGPSHSSHLLSR